MEARELEKEIRAIGFEADTMADLEYQVQTFTVTTIDDPDGIKADASTQAALEDLADELDQVCGFVEHARDELRAIAGRLEDEAEALEDEEYAGT
jgi:hypothetical protein